MLRERGRGALRERCEAGMPGRGPGKRKLLLGGRIGDEQAEEQNECLFFILILLSKINVVCIIPKHLSKNTINNYYK